MFHLVIVISYCVHVTAMFCQLLRMRLLFVNSSKIQNTNINNFMEKGFPFVHLYQASRYVAYQIQYYPGINNFIYLVCECFSMNR